MPDGVRFDWWRSRSPHLRLAVRRRTISTIPTLSSGPHGHTFRLREMLDICLGMPDVIRVHSARITCLGGGHETTLCALGDQISWHKRKYFAF